MTEALRTLANPAIALRPPQAVMRLRRLGSFHQSRLSFMRILLRRLSGSAWRFERRLFDLDERGVGRAVYCLHGPERSYSLVAFGHDLPADQRSDRVIATAWDATFTLFDGIPEPADLARLAANVPKQEAGRVSERELTVARANRSVRLFDYVVDCLAGGRQPDPEKIESVGYLMRTTAVYGSGKLGAADRERIAGRPEFRAPFQAEMMTVYLIRTFVLDLVEEMARLRAPDAAVTLEASLRRRFGIGNATGLGMAPFLLNHPALINNWIAARETALARVRGVARAAPEALSLLRKLALGSQAAQAGWHSQHPIQQRKQAELLRDLALILAELDQVSAQEPYPWNRLWLWAEEALSEEGQELLLSLLLEPYPDLVDDLADGMSAEEAESFAIDAGMTVGRLREAIEAVYDWALPIDWQSPDAQARVWYTSEEKLEPRLGERAEGELGRYEQPLSPGRDAARLYDDLALEPEDLSLAAFLLRHPEHRHSVRRAQLAARLPYAEIRDNTIGADVLPIDLLRAKLSFFGATQFDPKSDRWVRIAMFRHAPFPHELAPECADLWIYPPGTDAPR